MTNPQANLSIPKGFLFSGIRAGLKQEIKKDLGLIVTDENAVVGAVYTSNRFPSAHVQYCRDLTPNEQFRAMIINAGNANAATGDMGRKANLQMAHEIAQRLKIEDRQVLTSSTGIIGRPFPIEKIVSSLNTLVDQLGTSPLDAAEAIMTTDTHTKLASADIEIEGKHYAVLGFAKGSGMIHPDMGTMLAYIMTDAPVSAGKIQNLTTEVANRSFNCVSVDGDTSTNDSFFLISSNPASNDMPIAEALADGIMEVAVGLSKQIAADGEGAEHLLEVTVKGVPDRATAFPIMNAVLTSSLVKTAVNGRDPNWGRILMAVGNGLNQTTMPQQPKMSITMQGTTVFDKGEPQDCDEAELSKKLESHDVFIEVDLHQGDYRLTGWGCDFSDEYVRINADYST